MGECSFLNSIGKTTNSQIKRNKNILKLTVVNSLTFLILMIILSNINTSTITKTSKNSVNLTKKDIIFPANTPEPKISTLEKVKLTDYINKIRQITEKSTKNKSSSGTLSSDDNNKE
jgi:hypothetical protein